ncbi:WD40 repeat-like protein [Paxillus ammoniavirescens]|nr:WD40 repeat-like protein [Paxillus ammoniavirescens]
MNYPEHFVDHVVSSRDGSQLFSGSREGTILRWDTETGEPIGQPWNGHTDFLTSMSLSSDGRKLAGVACDRTLRFWDVQSGEPIGPPLLHEEILWALTFCPTGEFMTCGGKDLEVSIWRVPWWEDRQNECPAVPFPRVY